MFRMRCRHRDRMWQTACPASRCHTSRKLKREKTSTDPRLRFGLIYYARSTGPNPTKMLAARSSRLLWQLLYKAKDLSL
jgi:hypothetical protein